MNRRARAFFVFATLLFACASSGRVRTVDEASALFQARSLVTAHSLVVPPERSPGYGFYGIRDRWGQPRAPNGPAHAWAVAPFYALGIALARISGIDGRAVDLVITFGTVLSSAVFAALTLAMLLRLLEGISTPPRRALVIVVAVGCATPLFAYSGYLFSEPLTSACLTGAALSLFGREGDASVARGLTAGALIGVAFLARPGHAIAAPLFAASLWMHNRRNTDAILSVGIGFGTAVLISLLWNLHVYGDVLQFGYPETDTTGKHLNSFTTPLWLGLVGLTLTPGKSVFLFAPIIVLAILGVPALVRLHRGLGTLAWVLPTGYLLFYARFAQWEGGYSVGPRYLLPILPLLSVGLTCYLERSKRRWPFISLLACGVVMTTVSTTTGFLEDQQLSHYYSEPLAYRLTYAPQVSQTLLAARYVGDAITGAPPPALGRGFDRWFVFLSAGGVQRSVLIIWFLALLGSAAVTGVAFLRMVRSAGEPMYLGPPAQRGMAGTVQSLSMNHFSSCKNVAAATMSGVPNPSSKRP